jgi:RNA polymerase sigma-70 factor (ECF subfamily)
MSHDGEADDAALLAAARAGAPGAFNTLIDRHQQAVRAFLRRLMPDAAEADDVAQETFIAAWRGLGGFRGAASIRGWLCAIAWRKAQSAARSGARRRARDAAYDERTRLEQGGALSAEDRLALQGALEALPLEQRAAVALCLAGGFSHAEAALILGAPLGTIKSHVARGRETLFKSLGEAG